MDNSIVSQLDLAHTISDIKLMLPAKKDAVFVVVEGEDDLAIFSSLFQNAFLYKVPGTKRDIETIVCNHFPTQQRVIGIRDKDYQVAPVHKRIFHCDYCCAEMMIYSIDDCLERVCSSLQIFNVDYSKIRLDLLNKLRFISCVRKLNEINHWNLIINRLSVFGIYHDKIRRFESNIVTEINKRNGTNVLDKSRIEMVRKEKIKHRTLKKMLMITNGHDFTNLLMTEITRDSKRSQAIIQNSMISSFHVSHFKRTQLYRNLNDFCSTNGLSFLKTE